MIELKKSSCARMKFEDEEFTLDKPNMRAVTFLEESISKAETSIDKINVQKDFLLKLGMPELVYDQLEVEHIEIVFKELMPTKKK